MKRLLMIFGILALPPVFEARLSTAEAHTQSFAVGVRFGHAGYFYSALRPYGEWIEMEAGFYGWRPVRVRAGWRPYLHGRWIWTDYGWYWASYEPFGWAVFHYGRWYFDDYYGWIWIPDDVWGPAWVEWRYNDDYIGWAPLPPYATFSISVGIRFTTQWYAPSHYWCFVRYGHFPATRIDGYVVHESTTRRLIRTTRSAVRYEVDRDRVINRGVDHEVIERRGNTRISRADIVDTRDREERIVRRGATERIEVHRPGRSELERSDDRIEARRLDRGTTLNLERIERGRTYERRDEADERRTRQTPQSDTRERSLERRDTRREQPDVQRNVTPPSERRTTPERRDQSGEFRRIRPEQPSIQREGSSERRQPSGKSESRTRRGRDR
ncbi:MAG: hypothetical protein HY563_06045 [Ignavibacteriales bacterium]|nr:hypothetical protein [Ignavibacteriales bacterium]